MVPGGLLVTSYTTLLTSLTLLQIFVETARKKSGWNGYQSAVMPSEEMTARSATNIAMGALVTLDPNRPAACTILTEISMQHTKHSMLLESNKDAGRWFLHHAKKLRFGLNAPQNERQAAVVQSTAKLELSQMISSLQGVSSSSLSALIHSIKGGELSVGWSGCQDQP